MVIAVGDEGRQRMHVVRVLNNRNFIRLKDRGKKTRASCQGNGVQTDLRDTAGLLPDDHNKAKAKSQEFFGFPVHIKFMFVPYCSLMSVQKHHVSKKTMYITLI